jgi:hypothetical protein
MSELNKIKAYLFNKFNNLILNDNKPIKYPFMDPFINNLSQSTTELFGEFKLNSFTGSLSDESIPIFRPQAFKEPTSTPIFNFAPIPLTRGEFKLNSFTGSSSEESIPTFTPRVFDEPTPKFNFAPISLTKEEFKLNSFGESIPIFRPQAFKKPTLTPILKKKQRKCYNNIAFIKHDKDTVFVSLSNKLNDKRMKDSYIHTLFNLTSKTILGSSISLNNLSYFFEYEQHLGNLSKKQYFDSYIMVVIKEVYNEYLQKDKCCYHFIKNLMLEIDNV